MAARRASGCIAARSNGVGKRAGQSPACGCGNNVITMAYRCGKKHVIVKQYHECPSFGISERRRPAHCMSIPVSPSTSVTMANDPKAYSHDASDKKLDQAAVAAAASEAKIDARPH